MMVPALGRGTEVPWAAARKLAGRYAEPGSRSAEAFNFLASYSDRSDPGSPAASALV
jgi:hypothetical protein